MIPHEKPDIVYQLTGEDTVGIEYKRYNVRIANMQNAAIGDKIPQNSISQIETAKFDTLEIQNALFMTFAMPQYPTCGSKDIRTLYRNKYLLA
ncbi:MAG: hypothetical protein EZS28_025626 [Streblomastix strix]|uniref:Uncharacterized protein n=1 Tax=Streblomastix strix TaxID=222440 RepID=A0A5J4V8L5_9EUKA|nr:MAG: hypothetical protein EZS28_025626 [Streblomastix strix]